VDVVYSPVTVLPLFRESIIKIPWQLQKTVAIIFSAGGVTLNFLGGLEPLICHCINSCFDLGSKRWAHISSPVTNRLIIKSGSSKNVHTFPSGHAFGIAKAFVEPISH
jgi:hypothetical protein